MPHMTPSGIEALRRSYPDSAVRLRHGLAGHPLLQLDALAEAAVRMRPGTVDLRPAFGDDSAEGGFRRSADEGIPVDALIRDVARNSSWIGLCALEQLPEYDALLREIMADVAPVVEQRTGKCLDIRGFLFISPPGTYTPYHFDAEYNILFHIAGRKDFATFPTGQPFVASEAFETYHQNGDNLLPWTENFARSGIVHALEPGDALCVPFAAPHWVRAREGPCVSLSLTWQSRWSRHNGNAHRLNHVLRRRGLRPAPPPAWPQSAALRSTVYRAAHRAGLL